MPMHKEANYGATPMQNEIEETGALPSDGEKEQKRTRIKDGPIELFGGKLVNTKRMCEILKCPPDRLRQMMALPNGLPRIKIGARYWFDPNAVLAWLTARQSQANPMRRNRK